MKLALTSLLFISACSGGSNEPMALSDSGADSSPATELSGKLPGRIPEKEINAVIQDAKSGSLDAMAKLEEHYAATGDTEQYSVWLDMQVSKASVFAMQRKAAYLVSLHSNESCVEAKNLLASAARIAEDKKLREQLRQEWLLLEGKIVPEGACMEFTNPQIGSKSAL